MGEHRKWSEWMRAKCNAWTPQRIKKKILLLKRTSIPCETHLSFPILKATKLDEATWYEEKGPKSTQNSQRHPPFPLLGVKRDQQATRSGNIYRVSRSDLYTVPGCQSSLCEPLSDLDSCGVLDTLSAYSSFSHSSVELPELYLRRDWFPWKVCPFLKGNQSRRNKSGREGR
jgi:hypothetical protein